MSVDVKDLAVRALHTFWQALIASLGTVWAASGIDVSQITDVDAAKKALLALVAAAGAAVLSAAKTTVKGLASTLPEDTGAGWLNLPDETETPPAADPAAAAVVVSPAEQPAT